MRSHLLSQVVLKRFANGARKVARYDITTGDVVVLHTTDVAFRDVDTDLIGDLEQQWSREIENDGEKALNALQAGNALYTEKHVQTLKHLIGLHYIRSAIFVLTDRGSEKYRQQVINNTAAAYPEDRAEIEAKADSEWPRWEQSVAVKVLEDFLPKIQAYIDNHGLEVGTAPEGSEFILGDLPVITGDGNGRFGVIQGVGIKEARSCGMPMTPRHLVALQTHQTTNKYKSLTPKQVEAANDKQRLLAVDAYFTVPPEVTG